MEFKLILLHDDGEVREADTVPYHDENRINPRQAADLAYMIREEIHEHLSRAELSHPSRHYLPVITIPLTTGAEFRVVEDAYAVLDEVFPGIVRDCWLQYRW